MTTRLLIVIVLGVGVSIFGAYVIGFIHGGAAALGNRRKHSTGEPVARQLLINANVRTDESEPDREVGLPAGSPVLR